MSLIDQALHTCMYTDALYGLLSPLHLGIASVIIIQTFTLTMPDTKIRREARTAAAFAISFLPSTYASRQS
jgi:hypothetical protein